MLRFELEPDAVQTDADRDGHVESSAAAARQGVALNR
jgi:hypothetical protein